MTSNQSMYQLFDVIFENRVRQDTLTSHLWDARIAGKNFGGPFGHALMGGANECSDENPVRLGSLQLRVGDVGSFSGESASFKFKVVALQLDSDAPEGMAGRCPIVAQGRRSRCASPCRCESGRPPYPCGDRFRKCTPR
jgi:hypothetical protein